MQSFEAVAKERHVTEILQEIHHQLKLGTICSSIKKINVFKLNSDSSPAKPSPLQYQNMNVQNAKHETFCSFQHSEEGREKEEERKKDTKQNKKTS